MALSTGETKQGVVAIASKYFSVINTNAILTYYIPVDVSAFINAELIYNLTEGSDWGTTGISALARGEAGAITIYSCATVSYQTKQWSQGTATFTASGNYLKVNVNINTEPVRITCKLTTNELMQEVTE